MSMFKRRNTRRKTRHSASLNEFNILSIANLANMHSLTTEEIRPKRTRTRNAGSKTHVNKNDSVVVLDDSDDECLSTIVSRSHALNQNSLKEVDNFFKSSGLLSDDEDSQSTHSTIQKDLVKYDNTKSHTSSQNISNHNEEIIVLEDDPNEDIKNYCKGTEDILKNANAILEKFAGAKSMEEEKLQIEPSSEKKEPEKKGLGECPICYDNLAEKQVMTTKCGHLFCKACIEKVATTIKKCPTCRKAINKKNIIPIYI